MLSQQYIDVQVEVSVPLLLLIHPLMVVVAVIGTATQLKSKSFQVIFPVFMPLLLLFLERPYCF